MRTVCYVGGYLPVGLPTALHKVGFELVHFRSGHKFRRCVSKPAGVILRWSKKGDHRVLQAAKQKALPVVVISSRLAEAFCMGEPYADLYLEAPASNEECAALLIDLVQANELHDRLGPQLPPAAAVAA